ncbi:MAG TPA: hypothetical protein VH080_05060 [Gemmatimonadaceae bacterium]|nr:hypothetical protein [Gemmatimonadaceae bacterium]
MWSDVLQHAERLHVLRLCLWGALSTLAGTTVLVIGRRRSAFLRGFGWVCGLFGLLELLIASAAYRAIPLRDITGATRLDRGAWLQLGLFLGLMAVGVTIAVSPRVMKMRADPSPDTLLPAVGAGMAITLHGLALATLQLLLIADISR